MLHPYGRYCNAFKFAGEIDVLEALDSVKRRYRVDDDRIAVRGFSMGGAAAWQFAVHYPDRWFAANPGAGFSETPEFLKVFQQEKLKPTWWEQRLWHWYDCPDWCLNLRHCPTVAYSGEIDRKSKPPTSWQAALAEEGHRAACTSSARKTKHAIHPQSKVEIEDRLQIARPQRPRLAAAGCRFHDLHAPLQPDALADGRRPGRALDARRTSRPSLLSRRDRHRRGRRDRLDAVVSRRRVPARRAVAA